MTRRPLWTKQTAQSLYCLNLHKAEVHPWGRLFTTEHRVKTTKERIKNTRNDHQHQNIIKELVFIDTRLWRNAAREFSTLLHVSHFQSFICLWVLILRKRSTAFEDEITKAGAAKASYRISFLYMSFMCRAAQHEPPRASWELRIFSCLISHLWGKQYVLFKCQVVGQRL